MSTVYTAGMPTHQRRRRRALILTGLGILLTALIIGGLILWSSRDDTPTTKAAPAATCSAPPAGITVNVLNATSRAGIAGITADALRAQKFTVGEATNAPAGTRVKAPAEIRHGTKGADGAAVLARYVPGAALVKTERADTTVELVIGEAFGAVQAPASTPSC